MIETIEDILGGGLLEFALLTVVLFGGFGFMMGQAVAMTWRPAWQLVPYAVLLAAGNRFLGFALFGGELLSATGFLVDTMVVGLLASLAFRLTRAAKMLAQYPWLYERSGPFVWRDRLPP